VAVLSALQAPGPKAPLGGPERASSGVYQKLSPGAAGSAAPPCPCPYPWHCHSPCHCHCHCHWHWHWHLVERGRRALCTEGRPRLVACAGGGPAASRDHPGAAAQAPTVAPPAAQPRGTQSPHPPAPGRPRCAPGAPPACPGAPLALKGPGGQKGWGGSFLLAVARGFVQVTGAQVGEGAIHFWRSREGQFTGGSAAHGECAIGLWGCDCACDSACACDWGCDCDSDWGWAGGGALCCAAVCPRPRMRACSSPLMSTW